MSEQSQVTAQDLQRVEDKLDRLLSQVSTLHKSQQMLASLYEDLVPVATLAVADIGEKLADYEQRGYFDFAKETMHLIDNVVANYTPDDVHALGDNIVTILNAVKTVTQPEVFEFVENAADALEDQAQGEPPGVLGMLRKSSKDDDIRRGLAVALEALRQVGKAAHGPSQNGQHVNRLLGAKRNLSTNKALPAHSAPATPRPAPAPRPAPKAAAAPAPAPAAQPAADAPPPIEGVAFDADGFLADTSVWTEELAGKLAGQVGIALTDRHWVVLNYLREEYASSGASPNIRKITIGSGVPTKELFELFPRAPAKAAARIAGIPKPVGCV